MSTASPEFDAIVVGSGITGGWAAKELTELGLKVVMIERGRPVEHQRDYTTEFATPWSLPDRGLQIAGKPGLSKLGPLRVNAGDPGFLVDPAQYPYQTDPRSAWRWIRGYQMGGRSMSWARQCFRWSDLDFEANRRDGHGVDWPIRYADLAPWYDRVEAFAGISGSQEGLAQLPDGVFQPPLALNHVEAAFRDSVRANFPTRHVIPGRTANLTLDKPEEGRARCQFRSICHRGCSLGAAFSTLSATLPAARRTGNLTVLADSRVVKVEYDPKTRRASGVRVLDRKARRERVVTGRVVFLCASAFNSVGILLQSASEAFPHGLANSSGVLGRYLMDHATATVRAVVPGYLDRDYRGFRPCTFYVPRFRNATEPSETLLRGYGMQGYAWRASWSDLAAEPGVGAAFKERVRRRGGWKMGLGVSAEMLPHRDNHMRLVPALPDEDGLPQYRIELIFRENDLALLADGVAEAARMMETFGARVVDRPARLAPQGAVHEMGGARMGRDPATSVLNAFNQAHDVANVFVTDGAAMSSAACQNPSLTYMALTARAAHAAASMLREGRL